MKNCHLPILLFVILLFSAFLSCTDHLPTDQLPNHQRIKSLTQILPAPGEATFVSDFTYDSQNQLEFVKSYPVPTSIPDKRATTRYSFDLNKNISQVYRSFNDGPEGEYYKYTIGSFGQITELNYDGGGDEKYRMLFNFNGQQLASSSRRFTFSSVSFQQDIIYHFGGQNLSSADYTTTVTRNVPGVSTFTSTFTYDDRINPFFGMPVIPAPNLAAKPSMGNFFYYTFSGGLDNHLYLSRNNVISEKRSSLAETIYEYTYNSDGLPLTRITKRKNTPQDQFAIQETLVFEYETY